MVIDDDDVVTSPDFVSPSSSMHKKRKKSKLTADGEEEKRSKKSKKSKRDLLDIYDSDLESNSLDMQDEHAESDPYKSLVVSEQKTVGRSRMGGKITITPMPVKRVFIIKSEKLKKGNIWYKDCIPSADFWLPQEDAILCAVVHEYGPNWSFVSEILYSMTAGGAYRGRFRHPVHCCERFRELFQKYVLFSMDNANHEKINSTASGKALKVTEVRPAILTCLVSPILLFAGHSSDLVYFNLSSYCKFYLLCCLNFKVVQARKMRKKQRKQKENVERSENINYKF